MKKTVILGLLLVAACGVPAQNKISVRDFGAVPDDGQCDIAAINRAVKAAGAGSVIEFEAGTYNLFNENGRNFNMIVIDGVSGLTLQGRTDGSGAPSTRFELNVKKIGNDMDTACPLRILRSRDITVKNIAFDNRPSFASAGVITRVDRDKDWVEVEVFPGLPHFNGMSCYSANNWDLKSRELIPGPALTIGANPALFKHHWEKVPGDNDRLYRLQGMKFAAYVQPGQGMSWHFYVRNRGGALFSAYSEQLCFENLHFYNSKGVTVGSQFCKDLIYRRIAVKPVAPQLAVGARDAFHLVCNDGTLLVDDVYVKGVRWDPFNIKSKFCIVTGLVDRRTLKGSVITGVTELGNLSGSTAAFWIGDRPVELKITDAEWDRQGGTDEKNRAIRTFTLKMEKDLPPDLKPGAKFTPHIWNFDRAVIRNSTFEGNCGRPILYQGENLTVTGCVFKNNSYASIALGPIDIFEGGFVRNITIRDNKFINSTWLNTTSALPRNGTIKIYQDCPEYFKNQPYNDGIVIRDNLFQGINYNKNYSAVSVTNAQRVVIENNRYVDCGNNIYIDPQSTRDITVK